jgi:hypothetical protein
MASGGERPDLEALRELDEVLRHFENELASWRRRALSAEARLADAGMGSAGETASRANELEEENRALQQRIAGAKTRVGELLDRMRFLEEQQHPGGNGQ